MRTYEETEKAMETRRAKWKEDDQQRSIEARQELIDTIQEIEQLGSGLARTFVLSLAHNDMDLDMWERLIDGLKELHSKANSATLNAATLRRSSNH